jgi:hypothetical protein
VSPVEGERWPEALELAERMVGDTGDSIRAVLLYGSRLLKTSPDRHSALDFVVIVDDYEAFYRGMSDAGQMHRSVRILTSMAEVLPPNVIAYVPDDGREGLAKCLVVRKDHFAAALGPNPPDHFLLGRMVQRVGLLWAANDDEARWVEEQLQGAHARVLDWMAPYIEGSFSSEDLGRRLLEVCYQGEFRPESQGRAGRIFEAQADHFAEALRPGLEAAVASGRLIRDGDRYRLAQPAPPAQARRWRNHFRRSKLRTTTRWLKHMATFDNWLPYMVRKVERHTGRTIELTTLERKLPLLFLWPRAIYVLLTRPRREIGS